MNTTIYAHVEESWSDDMKAKVKKLQHHTCTTRCHSRGRGCKYGFPKPLSETTHKRLHETRRIGEDHEEWIFKRITEEDRHIVPYNPIILKLWDAHHNIEPISINRTLRYVTKYATKAEPSLSVSINEPGWKREMNSRVISTFEAVMSIRGSHICQSTRKVIYVPLLPPSERRTLLKFCGVRKRRRDDHHHEGDEEEHEHTEEEVDGDASVEHLGEDRIFRYFERPVQLDHLTLKEYFGDYAYDVRERIPMKYRRDALIDQSTHTKKYVWKRKYPAICRFPLILPAQSEQYFYALILKSRPFRSEEEVLGDCRTYRERAISLNLYRDENIYQHFFHGLQSICRERILHLCKSIARQGERMDMVLEGLRDINETFHQPITEEELISSHARDISDA
ncbi:hypothetical protein ADUPG1_001253, partial [Aduncisulcus paluster]